MCIRTACVHFPAVFTFPPRKMIRTDRESGNELEGCMGNSADSCCFVVLEMPKKVVRQIFP